ncbi:MAG: hypothetical protein Q7S60_03805 [bacterium]|nr:hypothetical protein [bacterium]
MTTQLESLQIKWLLFKRDAGRFSVRYFGFFAKPAYNAAPKNQSRRNFLKITGLGLGAIVVGKIVGDRLFSSLGEKHEVENQGVKVQTAGKGNYWKQTFLFSD